MSWDAKLSKALIEVYSEASPTDKRMLTGELELAVREKSARLNRLAGRLAIRAGLCAAIVELGDGQKEEGSRSEPEKCTNF